MKEKMRKLNQMNIVGIILILLSVVLFFLVSSYTSILREGSNIQCENFCGIEHEAANCPHSSFFPVQSYIGYTLCLILLLIGLFLLFYKSSKQETKIKPKRSIKGLDKDEKKVHDKIIESDGTIFQSDLVEKTGFNKVKVTRILDRLEGKGLIERKRRGMTNVVILR